MSGGEVDVSVFCGAYGYRKTGSLHRQMASYSTVL
jgi:hypothetical protein